MAAAKELTIARRLIAACEQRISAADERIKLAELEIEALKEARGLESQRAKELESVIAAEREAKDVLLRLKAEQEKRIVNLEKQLGRARKLALVTGVAAAVGILIAVSK